LLIQHGEVDPRVPISGAWKFYRTLKTMGKTVQFDIYPRGGHVLREPAQQRAQMQRNFDWFKVGQIGRVGRVGRVGHLKMDFGIRT
jgi:dipeptidyl aminopeptidase/acylaminoacyl peptidase